MLNQVLAKLAELGDEKTKAKYIKDGCDTELYGVKVGDLKKLTRELKLKHNNQLAIELIETKNYDAMYLGFLIMNPSDIDKELFIKWSEYSMYYRIRIHSLAYGMAEHVEYPYFIEYFKDQTADYQQSIYYAILAGRIIIDPEYNNQEMIEIGYYIGANINTAKYQEMPLTKVEMHSLIGYIGMQIPSAADEMIAIAEKFQPEFEVNVNRRIGNNINFIKTCVDHNTTRKKRKSARC